MNDLRTRLSKKNIKQCELAEMIGVSKYVVNNWVRGVAPIPHKYVDALDSILGKEYEYGEGKRKILGFIEKMIPNDFAVSNISVTFDNDGTAIIKIT